MKPSQFLKLVFFSGLISAAVLYFALRWTAPPVSEGGALPAQVKSDRSVSLSEDERNNIEIYKRTSPGGVNVTSTTVEYDFFYEPVPAQGIGSGSVIDSEGHILTNNHVIEGAEKLEVTLSDKSKYRARVIGADPVADVAVIKIDAPKSKLHPIPFSASGNIQVGQKVLAIGNPFGLQQTLTTGIVSSVNRSLRTENGMLMNDLIQTDAAINLGNSGGPLLNTAGEIIGVNTTIFSIRGGGNIGIGFAVGARTLNRLVPQLTRYGKVVRPAIGIRGQPIFAELAELLRLPVDHGVLIISLEPNSTADVSGLKGADRRVRIGNVIIPVGGDIIAEVGGQAVNSVQDIDEVLKDRNPGEKVDAVIYRDGQRRKVTLTLAEKQSRRLRF
ncbi:MAG TPA: trypsin-like peptidase domain-containing protein [Acidobacteriota bacterium]|nr:trypsin-like peptidase domain-containing protein [Acidobacteriota bacterium]